MSNLNDKMHNDSEKISASELNKYMYCPYSWYYERRYGRKYIRKLYLKRLDELNLTDEVEVNFLKGQSFHDEDFDKGRRMAKVVLVVIVVLAVLALFYFFGLNGVI